jgi:hypothetical protein
MDCGCALGPLQWESHGAILLNSFALLGRRTEGTYIGVVKDHALSRG